MKAAEVVVGNSYCYRSYSYASPVRFEAQSVEKASVHKRSGYGRSTRQTTVVKGLLYDATGKVSKEFQTEARFLDGDWFAYVENAEAQAKAQAAWEVKAAAERRERLPKVQALEAMLAEAGAKQDCYTYESGRFENIVGPSRHAAFNVHEVVTTGDRVQISLENLLLLVEQAKQQGYAEAQMAFSTEV